MKKTLMVLWLMLLLSFLSMPVYARGYYGEKLKGNEKKVYDSLEKAGIKKLRKYTARRKYLKLKKSVSRGALYRGYMSFHYDHPEYYWARGFLIRGTSNNKFRYICPYNLYYESILQDYKMIDAELKTAIRYVKKQKGRYNKVKAAHDYLNSLVEYGYQSGSGSHYCLAGMIEKNGRLMVCSGYARAFQAICLANKIPCIYVTGKANNLRYNNIGHAWNYVQMPDKKWYLVDCTWDDEKSGYNYEYFLKGSEDVNYYGYPMSSTHMPSDVAESSGPYQFKQKLPALAETGYYPEP